MTMPSRSNSTPSVNNTLVTEHATAPQSSPFCPCNLVSNDIRGSKQAIDYPPVASSQKASDLAPENILPIGTVSASVPTTDLLSSSSNHLRPVNTHLQDAPQHA